jgi:signal transduction histidine kinase
MDVASNSKASKTVSRERTLPEALSTSGVTRYLYGAVIAAGVIAAISMVIYLTLALGWRARAFPGFMVTNTLVIDGAQPLAEKTWPGLNFGLRRLDHIVAINGQALPEDYGAALTRYHEFMSNIRPGTRVQLEFNRPAQDGMIRCAGTSGTIGDCRIALNLTTFPDLDLVGFFLAPFLTGLMTLIIGFIILRLRYNQTAGLLASLICFSMAAFLAGLFDLNTTHTLIPLWIIATTILSASLIALSLIFPIKSGLIYRQPIMIYAPYVLGVIATVGLLWLYIAPPQPATQIGSLTFFCVLVGFIFMFISLLMSRRHASSYAVRDQSNTILIGLVLTGAPIVLWLVNMLSQFIYAQAVFPVNTSAVTPFAIVAPLSLAYAVLQYRLFDTDHVISQGITYSIMLVALIGGYFLLVFSVSLVFTQDLNNPLVVAFVVFLIAVLFLPVRTFLQTRIDKLYYRVRLNYQDRLEIFAHDTTQSSSFNAIVSEFLAQMRETIEPTSVFIFLVNRQATTYGAIGSPEPATEVQFNRDSGIIEALNENDQMLYLDPNRPWPITLRGERPRLSILNTMVILGLPGAKQLNGFICVGPPRSERNKYNYEELLFLQNLATQMAIATERSQVVESLERRVQELDVLSQVSQAVNFTINFDDLLELISAQTSKLIEAAYFYIALRDEITNELYFAFFLEDDERYREKEDRRWQMGRDLFSEVVRNGQAMRVANYAIAASQRSAPGIAIDPNLKAWMGVPLIAGPRTLGVMAVGMTQSSKIYGDDQFKVFSDISALAATSIDKARLFEETNRRARQLAALNNVSHQLAGELDVQKLLELVTRTAVEILNAEAGSLLLTVDDGSNELEFKIAIGSAGQNLIGTRFSSKRGLVGEVATKGKPVIVNDAAKDPRWGGELSKSDFKTNAILAVPLLAKNRIVGVLEVLNKRDGGVYVQEDVDLLTTFAGQAAVAIENARLFELTDLQLSARVDELETLERIDVELNRSLDLHRVAEITMRWAIANSGATAGVLGLVFGDPPHLEIVAKYGYSESEFPEGAEGNIWPLDRGIVSRVIRTRQPDIATDVSIDPSYIPSLRGALSQITVPMMSGGEISGILILETNKEPRLNLVDLSFVQRLAEHASIALTNAQLYAELARANDSKSEFVSFVAHELKTPMTSIKGFTDLLLGGLTGNLNEKQHSFLGTIRSNIDRMNTLVSDLNDVTKLQTNNLHMEFSPVDFRNIVTETLRPLQKQIEDKQQKLSIIMDDDLPPIQADQNRLIQVLTNLVSNAYKYTPREGGIRIKAEVSANRWDPKAKKTDQVLHIAVQDSGIGMSEEDLIKLFTPYFRSENPLAREQPGTGLGLTITHGIVRRHNGQIWVESKIGEGTTFHFIVPLATDATPQPSE